MVKISKKRSANDVFSESFRQFLREVAKRQKVTPTVVHECNCYMQICKGKFVRKFDWQIHCPWEMIRLGLIENVEELSKGKKFWEKNKKYE